MLLNLGRKVLPKCNTLITTLVQEPSDDVKEIHKSIDMGVVIESAALTVAVMQIHTLSRMASSRHPLATCGRSTTVVMKSLRSFLSLGQEQERAGASWFGSRRLHHRNCRSGSARRRIAVLHSGYRDGCGAARARILVGPV